ncbi:hypothetical protein GCM10008018_17210 [Paenibacillus marchantiophytorum]|uniref:SLH domain-containing protein n=1 Tax=Paenibacillus marchantiophytorum TaxID=1619310 RepID=A0ABQ2BSC0_9BACL|nr:hypothetical protein GCM10008018_17210 [Paenibacillus marchantiophytorum]
MISRALGKSADAVQSAVPQYQADAPIMKDMLESLALKFRGSPGAVEGSVVTRADFAIFIQSILQP